MKPSRRHAQTVDTWRGLIQERRAIVLLADGFRLSPVAVFAGRGREPLLHCFCESDKVVPFRNFSAGRLGAYSVENPGSSHPSAEAWHHRGGLPKGCRVYYVEPAWHAARERRQHWRGIQARLRALESLEDRLERTLQEVEARREKLRAWAEGGSPEDKARREGASEEEIRDISRVLERAAIRLGDRRP